VVTLPAMRLNSALVPPVRSRAFDAETAWDLLRALGDRARAGQPLCCRSGFRIDEGGRVEQVPAERAPISIDPAGERAFQASQRLDAEVEQMLELYLPLCVGAGARDVVIGHVGQSLDGQIATLSGASRYVSGPENLRHMHRLRALCDAVIVGARTVELDDPQLTTRLVPGKNPIRVVIDSSLRLLPERHLYRDGGPPTLVVCGSQAQVNGHDFGHAEIVRVPNEDGALSARAVVSALGRRGLRRLFIEGGGITISRFLEARALDRLHVTICPLFIGSGRPGIVLPGIDDLDQALRPRTRRFVLGEDVLFDCQLQRAA